MQECKALGVFTQQQALEYLGTKLNQRGFRAGMERRRRSKVRGQLSRLHLACGTRHEIPAALWFAWNVLLVSGVLAA